MSYSEIVVNIHDPYRKVARTWASVRRTLEAALKICEFEAANALTDTRQEQANHTVKELEAIIPMLEHLHYQVREKLWISESAASAPVIWPYDEVAKRWAVVVESARTGIFVTDGASYILGDPATFPPIHESMKFKVGAVDVMLVSIDGGGRVRWVVKRDSFEATDKEAIRFFGL